MYEKINEELGIMSCEIGDLTVDQVSSFLGQWEEGARIGTLTLFCDKNTGNLVLNKSNKDYETYLSLAEAYMGSDSNTRKMIHKNNPLPELKETLNVMERCLKYRRTEREIFRAKENVIRNKMALLLLEELVRRYNPTSAVYLAYKCGMMQGKRAERHKKRQSANA